MAGQVTLTVIAGPLTGKAFSFEEHDVLLFGRDPQCHVHLPEDNFISRRHLAIEVNPPQVTVRDLNSLNGIVVNGMHIKNADRANAAASEPLALVDGDQLQAGQTVFRISVVQPAAEDLAMACVLCGGAVPQHEKPLAGGDYLCEACSEKVAANPGLHQQTMVKQGVSVRGQHEGEYIGDYKVGERLAEGASGAVFLAESRTDGRRVVIKVLHSRLASDKKSRESFIREMRLLQSLDHENIVPCLDFGSAGTTIFLVLEYCNQNSLARHAAASWGKLPWEMGLPWFRQVLTGLHYAHTREIVHRDLKPDNIFLHDAGNGIVAKVGDFGLAKVYTLAGVTQFTQAREYAGSFHFMPKDQLFNYKFSKPVCDIWSAAATFYNALTGQYPRDMPIDQDPIDIISEDRIRPVEQWGVEMPPALAAAINRGLASDPAQRWQSALDFRSALDVLG